MKQYQPDWDRVLQTLQARFPLELEVAMLTVRVETLEALEPVDGPVETVDGH